MTENYFINMKGMQAPKKSKAMHYEKRQRILSRYVYFLF